MQLVAPRKGRAAATFPMPEGVWTLYELPARNYEGSSLFWQPFKLMLPPETRSRWGQRRSYRLTWNADELRFRKDRDCQGLALTHAELFLRAETYLSLHYDAVWLRTDLGMTDEEIEAERVRLRAMSNLRRRAKQQSV